MALRPEDQKRVNDLTEAAQHLRTTGAPQLADSVDYVLSMDGLAFIGRLRLERMHTQAAEGDLDPNLPMAMPRPVRDQIKSTARQQGRDLTAEAHKALEEFCAGRFTPDRPVRAAHGSGEVKVNLNLRVNADLRARAEKHGKDVAAELGWAPRASHVITGWLIREFTGASR
ncbi:hypothetical protein [Streptomyces sp. rh34]|uniref:hypothetical protein n=1 Tax=Streptomyces sp. rh34 TaxID=2034272 RepID=UPI000BEF73CD|nr:hypothetical protein [Streptomyces sp. rh34]